MVNEFYIEDDDLLRAIKMARVNKLYSPEQGLLTNYIDFESIIKADANALMTRDNLGLTMVISKGLTLPAGVMLVFKMKAGVNNLWSFVRENERNQGVASEMFGVMQLCRDAAGLETENYSYGSPYLKELLG